MAHTPVLAAVDLGAGSGRVMAATLDSPIPTLKEVHRFSRPPRLVDGLWRWDLEFVEAEIRRGLGSIGGHLGSVGIDTWGVDFVLVGDQGPVEAPRCYRNEHTRDHVAPTHALLDEQALYGRTGIQTQHFNTLYQLVALKAASPEVLGRARRLALVPDWLNHRLGGPLVNELTNASTTQLLDARTRDWDGVTLEALGLDRGLFSTPVPPGTSLGPVTLGDQHPTLVAPATHDTGSAVAAVPLRSPRSAYVATGTWCLIGVEIPEPETGEAARRANFTNESGVGGYRFLKNCMGLWLLQQLRASWSGCPDFGALTEAASRAPAFAALVDADHPSFFQPPSMKAALEDYWARTGQRAPEGPGGYARACVEGLALVFRKTLRQIEAIRGTTLDRVHLVGGGCQNSLLCQLTADATGLVVEAGPVEASSLGNVMVQAEALGLVPPGEGRELVSRWFPPVIYRPRGLLGPWDQAEARLAGLPWGTAV